MRTSKRGAVVATAAVAAVAVGSAAAWAYFALSSNSDGAAFVARALTAPASAGGTPTSSTAVTLSWTPGTQVTGAQFVVTNTLDNHTACTVAATVSTCSDTAALPGVANTYSVRTTLPGTTWSSQAATFSTAATAPVLALTGTTGAALGTQAAGTAFGLKVTAQKWQAGSLVTDTSYAGSKTLAWSGLTASPNGTAPTYPATTVAFTSGASTNLTATAVRAGSATLTATQGSSTGSATFTVNSAASAGALRFTSASLSCASGTVTIPQNGTFTAKVSRDADAYGNAPTGAPTVTVSVPQSAKGTITGSPIAFANGATETTGSFTYTGNGKDTNGSTITAASTGYTSATCLVKQ